MIVLLQTPRIIEAKAGTKNPAKDDASVAAPPAAVPDATTDGKVSRSCFFINQ